jgi:hypothetical protein
MNESTMPLIKDFRPFLPSGKNGYDESKKFYQEIGFTILWSSTEVTEFGSGCGHRFLLSANQNKALGENLMLQIWVENVDEWFEYLKSKKLEKKFAGTKINAPEVMPWGWRIVYVSDPAGVLLHFAEPHSEENRSYFNKAEWIS